MAWRPLILTVVLSLVASVPLVPATTSTCTDTDPPNDCRVNATVLTVRHIQLQQSNVNAGTEPGEFLPADIGNTVWYRFTASLSTSGSFSVANSNHQAGIAIYEEQTDGTLLFLDHASGWSGNSWATFNCVAGRTYFVQAGGEEGLSGMLDVHGSICLPDVPSAPSVTASPGPARGDLRLTWTAGPDGGAPVTGWTVERASPTCSGFTSLTQLPAGSAAFTDAGRPEGVVQCYRVRATNSAGAGAWSTPRANVPLGVPSPVVGLVAAGASGRIDLDWSPALYHGGSAIQGHRVYASDSANGPFDLLWSGTADAITQAGLPQGAWRHYRVVAWNAYGESAVSTASARVWAPPTAPAALSADWAFPVGVLLEWERPADDGGLSIMSYHIYRAPAGQPLQHHRTVSGTTLSYTDQPTVLRGYDYAVLAVNAEGSSPLSQTTCGEAVPTPSLVGGC